MAIQRKQMPISLFSTTTTPGRKQFCFKKKNSQTIFLSPTQIWNNRSLTTTPVDQFDDLAKYDGSVIVERTRGEFSARCDHQEMKFIAIDPTSN